MAYSNTPSEDQERKIRQPVVRHATATDLAAIGLLYRQLSSDASSPEPALPELASSVFAKMSAQSGRHLLVADVDATVVGTADLLVASNLTHRGRPWAIVENVVVDEAVRGQGVGRALIEEAVRISEGADCYKVQLLSRKQRTEAHEFYRRIGFEAVAEGFRLYLH
jgi:ribosomal protein S18 acetylase RimI-like enzyme